MKKKIKKKMKMIFTVFLLFMVFALPAHAQKAAAERDKLILTTQEVAPYVFYNKKGNLEGYAISAVRYILEKMNQPYEIRVFPWKRSQVMVEKGDADGFFPASRNAERDAYAIISKDICEQTWNWYLLKSNPLDPNAPDFKEKASVAAFYGTTMLQWLEENNYNVKGNPQNTELLVKMLLGKRFDAMLANHLEMGEIIKAQNLEDKLKVSMCKEKPLGAYFSKNFLKNHPDFLEKFNNYAAEYRASLSD